jgi:hypothetical protein
MEFVRKQNEEGKRAMSPSNLSDADLPPDRFLYERKGPWPQPSPAHPLTDAAEVLNVPLVETAVWDIAVGLRLAADEYGYAPAAARLALKDMDSPIPTDDEFNNVMLKTAYSRFMKPGDGNAKWIYDFSAMKLIKPIEGLYCAPVQCRFGGSPVQCTVISFRNGELYHDVYPSDGLAWNLAKVYALQAAIYHMLFIVHPALHFPMDSVNAITKTAVPQNHPLFQLLYPHTALTLPLDNSVLEGAGSPVNKNVQGTWFDPFMGEGYNLKLLFGAGYSGLQDPWYGNAYPAYDFMKPQMGFDSEYGRWLAAYFPVFLEFCTKVATKILADNNKDTYVTRWARYNTTYVRGFPDEKAILNRDCLAKAMAIFMWDVSVSHAGDHYSIGYNVAPRYKFLRIRNYPPISGPPPAAGPTKVSDVAVVDDLFRAEMAQQLFFRPWGVTSLYQTAYAFTDSGLQQAADDFQTGLGKVSQQFEYGPNSPCMPLSPLMPPPSQQGFGDDLLIPASIQY